MDNKNIKFDTSDWYGMIKLMDEYGDSVMPYEFINEDGETVILSIAKDNIKTSTLQSNGWIRVNIYHRDGYVEEMFER